MEYSVEGLKQKRIINGKVVDDVSANIHYSSKRGAPGITGHITKNGIRVDIDGVIKDSATGYKFLVKAIVGHGKKGSPIVKKYKMTYAQLMKILKST